MIAFKLKVYAVALTTLHDSAAKAYDRTFFTTV
jgi:hypothetical protein